jgi:hypothetical protein
MGWIGSQGWTKKLGDMLLAESQLASSGAMMIDVMNIESHILFAIAMYKGSF